MKATLTKALLLLTAALQPVTMAATAAIAAVPASGGLRAGSARVDITPRVEDLPQPFTSIGEKIFVRTVVLESGGTRAVIVVGDLPTIAPDIFDMLRQKIATEVGTPIQNVLLAVTHTHNAVRLDNVEKSILLPGSAKVTAFTTDLILKSVKQAASSLQPARAGYGSGVFRLGTARMEGGERPNGPPAEASDRGLGVFKVESLSGEPIALLVNNGPEPVMGMGGSRIGPDVAGVMERYVEQRYGDKPVVLYTVGSPPGVPFNGRQKIPGATPADPNALMAAVGTVLGEEVLSTSSRIKTSEMLKIAAVMRDLVCPGKVTTPLNNPNSCSDAPGATLPKCVFTTRDSVPVKLRMGVLQLGDLALVQSDADVLPGVWAQVKQGAPVPADTMLVSLVYGPVKYVVEDKEYPSNSYPVTASMVKPGCAAPGFVKNSLEMLRQTRPGS